MPFPKKPRVEGSLSHWEILEEVEVKFQHEKEKNRRLMAAEKRLKVQHKSEMDALKLQLQELKDRDLIQRKIIKECFLRDNYLTCE